MSKSFPKDLFLVEGISHFCFNNNFTQVKKKKKNHIIEIYKIENIKDFSSYKLLYTLSIHNQYISGLDWHSKTNKILSCSYDKTSFISSYDKNKKNYISENVIVSTKLGYLTCSWNNRGDKFVLGSSNRQLIIGYFNKENNWWIGKNIKCHKSSVTCAKISPNNLFVISGSIDMKVYISSCYIKDIDEQFITNDIKNLIKDFGIVIYEFNMNSWVNCVNFNENDIGYAASQNSLFVVLNYKSDKNYIVKLKHSPFVKILPKKYNEIYAVDYNRNIYLYECLDNKWNIKKIFNKENNNDIEKSNNNNENNNNSNNNSNNNFINNSNNKSNNNDYESNNDNESNNNDNESNKNENKKENLIIKIKENEKKHSTNISSITIKQDEIITTDLAGFVKFWNI